MSTAVIINFIFACQILHLTVILADISTDPKFSTPIANATASVGRDAFLTCRVHDLGSFKIAWLRVDTQTILSIQNHVITKNQRIGVSHTEHRIWQLRIRDIREADRGWYMCQINTDPMKSQVGYLDVVVPPDIIDYETSHDIIVEEGQNATLTCSASGLPKPTITWRREKDTPLILNGNRKLTTFEGQNLTLYNISRYYMGPYLCIASNGYPPTVSKRILLLVNFAPKIWTNHKHLHAPLGQKIILECITESHPTSVNYWLREKEFIQGGTYESITQENIYKIVMKLIIRPVKLKDFGEYKCVARNSIGLSETTIVIHQKLKADTRPPQQRTSLGSNIYIISNEMDQNASNISTRNNYLTILFFLYGFLLTKCVNF